jgi:putative membrane protein
MNLAGSANALLPVAIVGAWYAVGLVRMWERVGVGRLVSRARVVAFVSGLFATAVALGPPLDTLADRNLTAHMGQHVLLIFVAAPLLVVGAPFPVLLWAFSDRRRIAWQRGWRRVHRSVAGDAWPLWVGGALTVQAVTLMLWHVPLFYDAAVHNDAVHAAEHATFLFTAIAFWWTAAGAVRRARYGALLIAVFIAKLPGLLIGVGMTFDRHVWYPVYGHGAHALDDQQFAGVLMWVGGGTIAAITALWTFALWMHSLEVHSPSSAARTTLHVPDVEGVL